MTTDTTAVPEFCHDCGEAFRPGDKRLILGDRKYHAMTCGPAPTTDTEGEAVAEFDYHHMPPGERAAFANGQASRDAAIATLSRQLAEAQEARDLNAAALECYSAEQARLRKELAEAQGVIERQREECARIAESPERWPSPYDGAPFPANKMHREAGEVIASAIRSISSDVPAPVPDSKDEK